MSKSLNDADKKVKAGGRRRGGAKEQKSGGTRGVDGGTERRTPSGERPVERESSGHGNPPYFMVFVLLAVLTVVEIWISGLDINRSRQITILMVFATAKALLVVLYYMHLRYESRILSYILLIPLGIALMFVFVLLI